MTKMIMNKKKTALFPGSFDPFTCGHYDIAVRAADMFDELHIISFVNCQKSGMFTASERLEIMRAAFAGAGNIIVGTDDGLMADYAEKHGIGYLVKGLRNSGDFEYEYSLSDINRHLYPGVETVLLPSRPELAYISSTYVRELIKYGRPLENAIPADALDVVQKIISYKRATIK